ncbi:hypothetical protein [Hymenobacter psychrophilus]|uniref:Uncharacterized protein n=1 Tax=Hymenobacter psychrophilus TaxID=651662 RepID=A0A1H3LQL9_9BACT|nr:hypothetical protein [Hymenobacter psychrophilus]SDY66626.1 hypothetical protein SAMN04488069_11186 [Hymenobacter psychrophilus]
MQEQAIKQFEQLFVVVNTPSPRYPVPFSYEKLRADYHALFDALLALLALQGIDYDDFIEQEILAWSDPLSKGNPCELPFEAGFLKFYTSSGYKFSFLVLCLQIQPPVRNISTPLLLACYHVLNDSPGLYARLTLWLDSLVDYPNPNAIGLVAAVLPLLNNDWYGQDLHLNLPYLLTQNPGPVATAVQAQLTQVTEVLDAANRV